MFLRIMMLFMLTLLYFPLGFANRTFIVHCPEQIQTQQSMSSTPADWRALNADARYYWNGVTVYSGKPEDNASLIPSKEKSKAKWQFKSDEEAYVVCEYNQTSLRLTQKLPMRTTACHLTYDHFVMGSFGPIPKQLECETLS